MRRRNSAAFPSPHALSTWGEGKPLHPRVVRPAAALRHRPVDVLIGVLDVAGLAVYAVLRVDDEARKLAPLLDPLVDAGGTIAGGRTAVYVVFGVELKLGVGHLQVCGLILLVIGAREGDVGQA